MRHTINVVTALSLLMPLCLAAESQQDLEGAVRDKACVDNLAAVVSRYEHVRANSLADARSERHVPTVFSRVHARHTELISSIVAFLNDAPRGATVTAAGRGEIPLAEQLNDIDTTRQKLATASEILSHDEHALMLDVIEIERQLDETQDEFASILRQCPGNYASILSPLTDDIAGWQKSIGQMRRYLAAVIEARGRLLAYAFLSAKERAIAAAAAATVKKIGDMRSEVEMINAVSGLTHDVLKWYNDAAGDAGRSLAVNGMQYEEPLRMMHVQLEEGRTLSKRVEAVAASGYHAPGEAFSGIGPAELRKKITSATARLERDMGRIQTSGWRGVLALQKTAFATALRSPASVTHACAPIAQALLSELDRVATFAEFHSAEERVLAAQEVCLGRKIRASRGGQ